MTAFRLTEVKADLFHVPQTYSLAYTTNANFYEEKGKLAWKFGIIFGQHDELSRRHICSGNVAVLEDNARFIYSLVTKDSMFYKSTYENVESALICMRQHMVSEIVFVFVFFYHLFAVFYALHYSFFA